MSNSMKAREAELQDHGYTKAEAFRMARQERATVADRAYEAKKSK